MYPHTHDPIYIFAFDNYFIVTITTPNPLIVSFTGATPVSMSLIWSGDPLSWRLRIRIFKPGLMPMHMQSVSNDVYLYVRVRVCFVCVYVCVCV